MVVFILSEICNRAGSVLVRSVNSVLVSGSPCADPVLIPTHTISRTTNSLDTITNTPDILTVKCNQILTTHVELFVFQYMQFQ